MGRTGWCRASAQARVQDEPVDGQSTVRDLLDRSVGQYVVACNGAQQLRIDPRSSVFGQPTTGPRVNALDLTGNSNAPGTPVEDASAQTERLDVHPEGNHMQRLVRFAAEFLNKADDFVDVDGASLGRCELGRLVLWATLRGTTFIVHGLVEDRVHAVRLLRPRAAHSRCRGRTSAGYSSAKFSLPMLFVMSLSTLPL